MQDIQQIVGDVVQRVQPASLLVLGSLTELPALGNNAAVRRATELAEVPSDERADLALVDSDCGTRGSAVAGALARLRDLVARRVLVIVRASAGPEWSRSRMISYGYLHYGEARDANQTVRLYQFDIDHYKHTPDWLGPHYWANPELWDKYRW